MLGLKRMTPRRFILLLMLLAAGILLVGYRQATADPVVRQARIGVVDWPKDQPPLRLVLISDVHVAGPDMPPARLARIVEGINSLSPDLVLIAGDFVSDKKLSTHQYSEAQATAPLRHLRASLGIVAVLGNHDH